VVLEAVSETLGFCESRGVESIFATAPSETMAFKELTVGIFGVKQLSELRWRITNTLTTYVHVTYGPESEVIEQLEVQTKAWKGKLDPAAKGKRGSAWRQKSSAEYAQAQATKTGT
jgi:hypothetical protein